MTLFIFTWTLIGLAMSTLVIWFCKNTTLMDFMVVEFLQNVKDSGTDIEISYSGAETIIIVLLTLMYVIAWPLFLIRGFFR